MALVELDLYSAGALAHSGTQDTGGGVGMLDISPGFAGGWDVYGLAAPAGIQTFPSGYFCHGGYFYLLNTTDDKIHRYAIDAAANLTPESSQTMANMGLAGDAWIYWGNCLYDPSDGSVIICTYDVTPGTYTPVVGKWLCSSWPFTNVNAEWLSPVVVRYGGFTAGQLTNWYYPSLCTATNKLYLCSHNAGQVITLDATDGSVLGAFEPSPVYNNMYQFLLAGFDDANKPVGSQFASVGLGQLAVYDDTDPAAWAKGDVVFLSTLSLTTSIPFHDRNQGAGYVDRNRMVSLHDSERALVGLPDMAWWSCNRATIYGEMYLHSYDFGTSEHCHRSVAQAGDRRAIGNASAWLFSHKFIEIAGQPWLVSYNMHNQDIEDENPGASFDNTCGLVFTPMGTATVTYTIPPEEVPGGTPKRLEIGIDAAASNYMFSDSPGKHKVRFQVIPVATGIPGPWSEWRTGTRQLQALNQVVDGLAAWPAFAAGDTLKFEHAMCSGWPTSFAPAKGNPGGVGDPTPVNIHSADVGPPREVRPVLLYEGGAVVHTLIGVEAEVSLVPNPLSVAVEVG